MTRVKSRASYPYVPSSFRRSTKHQPRIHRCTVTITGEEAVFFVFFNKSKRLPLNSNLPRSGLRGELVVMKCGKRGQAISLTSRKDHKLAAWLAPRYGRRFSCTSAYSSTIVLASPRALPRTRADLFKNSSPSTIQVTSRVLRIVILCVPCSRNQHI